MSYHWPPRNLRKHYIERMREDPGCLEDVLGIVGKKITIEQYEAISFDVVRSPWARYEGEAWDRRLQCFREKRAYHVDDNLLVAITAIDNQAMITCFHKHLGAPNHDNALPPRTPLGTRRLRYREHLNGLEMRGRIRNLRRINGV